jgi:hypothetical protein
MLNRSEISLQMQGANTGFGKRSVKRFPLFRRNTAFSEALNEQAQVPHEY